MLTEKGGIRRKKPDQGSEPRRAELQAKANRQGGKLRPIVRRLKVQELGQQLHSEIDRQQGVEISFVVMVVILYRHMNRAESAGENEAAQTVGPIGQRLANVDPFCQV